MEEAERARIRGLVENIRSTPNHVSRHAPVEIVLLNGREYVGFIESSDEVGFVLRSEDGVRPTTILYKAVGAVSLVPPPRTPARVKAVTLPRRS
jgi:sRNA-binding regulator protein Hfq